MKQSLFYYFKLRCSKFLVLMLNIQYGILNDEFCNSYFVNRKLLHTPSPSNSRFYDLFGIVESSISRGECVVLFKRIGTFLNFQICTFSKRKSSRSVGIVNYLNVFNINKVKLVITLPILTHSPVDIFLVNGFSGTTICEPAVTVG